MTTQARCDPPCRSPDDGGQRRRDDGLVEGRQQHAEQQGAEDQPEPALGDLLHHGGRGDDAHTHLPDVCHDRLRVGTSWFQMQPGWLAARLPPDPSRRPPTLRPQAPLATRATVPAAEAGVAARRATRIDRGRLQAHAYPPHRAARDRAPRHAGRHGRRLLLRAGRRPSRRAGGFGCLGASTMGDEKMVGGDGGRARRDRQALRRRPAHGHAGRHDRAGQDHHRGGRLRLRGRAGRPDRGRRPVPPARRGRRQHVRQGRARRARRRGGV